MMKQIIISLLFFLGFSSTSFSQKVVSETHFCELDTIKSVGVLDSLTGRSGIWLKYRNDTLYKMNTYEKGQLQGASYYFYSNGKIKMYINYDNNRVNGEFKYYSINGDLLAIYKFIYDKLDRVIYYVLSKESPPNKHGDFLFFFDKCDSHSTESSKE